MAKKLKENELNKVSGGIEYRHYERDGSSPAIYSYRIEFRNILTGATDVNSNSGMNRSEIEGKYNTDKGLLLSYPDIQITYDSGILVNGEEEEPFGD